MAVLRFPHIDFLSLRNELIHNLDFYLNIDHPIRARKVECPHEYAAKIKSIVDEGLKAFNTEFLSISSKVVKGKTVYFYTNEGTRLVDTLIGRYLRRFFQISSPSRNALIDLLLKHLQEPLPYGILRLDIKNFYESINTAELMKEITQSDLQSEHLNFIKKQFLAGGRGIKRGLSLGNVLSEVCLKKLDNIFNQIDEVILYERFVDDILIIYDCDKRDAPNTLLDFQSNSLIKEFLNRFTLEFHSDDAKLFNTTIPSVSEAKGDKKKKEDRKEFDYLGYHFSVSNKYMEAPGQTNLKKGEKNSQGKKEKQSKKNSQLRLVEVDLSEKSFKKIEARLRRSFSSYHTSISSIALDPRISAQVVPIDNFEVSPNAFLAFKLLEKRISFLVNNYRLFNQKKKVHFINGIYFGFRAVNTLEGRLLTLDKLLSQLIWREKSNASSAFLQRELDRLNRHSFRQGFQKQIFVHFSVSSLKEIKRCWRQI